LDTTGRSQEQLTGRGKQELVKSAKAFFKYHFCEKFSNIWSFQQTALVLQCTVEHFVNSGRHIININGA
jgi:hypothetical protein